MSGSIDMSVAGDLSTAQDLTAPADLENACGYADDAFMSAPVETVACGAGQTSIAGTCAAEFWTLVADCFHPAGCCVWNGLTLATPASCYASGACFREDIGFGSVWYMQDGKMCGKDEGLEQNGGPGSIIHRRWTSADGRVWLYNTMTGDIQCPNGTHVNAGSGLCGYESRGDLNPFFCPSINSHPACCTPYDPRR